METLDEHTTRIDLQPGDTVVIPGDAPHSVRASRAGFELPVGGFVVSAISERTDGIFGDTEVGPCYGFTVSTHVSPGHWLVRDLVYGTLESPNAADGATYTGSCEHLEACTNPNAPGEFPDHTDEAADLGLDPWSRPISGVEEYVYDHLPADNDPADECAAYLRALAVAAQA